MSNKEFKWDVKIGDKVEYFDPLLSYEISGYRPINDVDGLDFNPDWFREAAISKLRTNSYSNCPPGSHSQRVYWVEQKRRCEKGYTINGYTLTGDNYFWLNFYRLKTSNDGDKTGGGRHISFPTFYVFQYEYFHYLEICEQTKHDLGMLKARGLGFSEIAASLCARPYTTTANYRVMASAATEKFLKPLLSKIWAQLDYLNKETETAFKRLRMVINTATHKRASMKDKRGEEFGHLSEIEGIVADEPQKIRGDRVERLFYEEAGSDKHFQKKYLQGEALITVMGGRRIGTRIAWGTGGDSGPALSGIRHMTNNPEAYNVLPFRHNYTPDGKYIFTAMFIPAYRVVTDDTVKLVDKRGWTNANAAIDYYNDIRAKKANDPSGLLIYKAEYCFTIEEALIQQGDNIFPREELAEQDARIEIYKEVTLPKKGSLVWKWDTDDRIAGVKWRQEEEGKILILEHPLISEEGTSYKNLYVGGIDSIDIGSNDSAAVRGSSEAKRLSDFCIVIKKRVFGQSEPVYVAMYKDRPRDIREAYDNAAKLLTYYGCQAVLESTRTAILTYFRDKKLMNLLMKRPRSSMPDVTKGNSNMYGAPATDKTIKHYRELIYDFVLDYCHTIAFSDMIKQLLNYSDATKKEFDIIAAMGMCELGDEELSVKIPIAREAEEKVFRHIGWYKDGKGYKHYGEIPLTTEERNGRNRISKQDSWLYKDTL